MKNDKNRSEFKDALDREAKLLQFRTRGFRRRRTDPFFFRRFRTDDFFRFRRFRTDDFFRFRSFRTDDFFRFRRDFRS